MSLRDRLKRSIEAELHVALPKGCNCATSGANDATGHATPMQQLPANPHEITLCHATADATSVQPGQKSSATTAPKPPPKMGSELQFTRVREMEAFEPWEGQEPDPQDLAHLRLMAMGLDSNTADTLAAWMMLRSESGEDQVICYECQHFKPKGKLCGNHRQADMPRELGTDLATKPQRCPGFTTSQPFIQNGANPAMVWHSG